MTTWFTSGPVSHPWFKQNTTKRKLSEDDASLVSSRSRNSSVSPPPSKRHKQSTILEVSLSSLSLANEPRASHQPHYVSEPDHHTDYAPMDSDDDPPRDVFSTSIEEPFIPEVKMKSSSWYEPEPDRIIVTSLELSDDEEEATDPDTTTLSIPPALLKQLMSQSPRDLRAPQIPPSRLGSQALVLFKPLPVSNIEEQASDKVEGIVKDDDAMDVEP